MRERILEILRSKMPAPVSGEVLSQELAVSRTAIWKHIQALKNEGYTIESVPKKGYILKEVPDRLKPAEVVANLNNFMLQRTHLAIVRLKIRIGVIHIALQHANRKLRRINWSRNTVNKVAE